MNKKIIGVSVRNYNLPRKHTWLIRHLNEACNGFIWNVCAFNV